MRKMGLALTAIVALAGCKGKSSDNPVDQILETGIQAEKDLAENEAKRTTTKDIKEAVELGKQEKAIIDEATAKINQLLGGKGHRLPVALGQNTDTLPVNFGHGSIGIPDFFKGEFKINLQISGTNKRPLPTGLDFKMVALDAQGKVLATRETNMVDSARIGDSLYAGGMFKGADIKGLAGVVAR